jgi:hypothetical protein
MKLVGSIHIDDAPLGMMIKHSKTGKYYISNVDKSGEKIWKLCTCNDCVTCTKSTKGTKGTKGKQLHKQRGGTKSTELAPSPEEHSWHHHHAPFYQVFNNYVCVKRDTLGEIRDFFIEMFAKDNYLDGKPPFS